MSVTFIFILSVILTIIFGIFFHRFLNRFSSRWQGKDADQKKFNFGCLVTATFGIIIICILFTVVVWTRGKDICTHEDFQIMPFFLLIIGAIAGLGGLYEIGAAILGLGKNSENPQSNQNRIGKALLFFIPLIAGIIMWYSISSQCTCSLMKAKTPYGNFPKLKNAEKKVRFIRGKILVVYKGGGGVVSDMQCGLPDEIRADSMDEVQTVVWVDDFQKETARYTYEGSAQKAASAYQVHWQLTVIDLKDRQIVNRTIISGDPPSTPKKISKRRGSDLDLTGPRPVQETIHWLSMPGLRRIE